jgi:hypothetical protein
MRRSIEHLTICLGDRHQIDIKEQLAPDPILFQFNVIGYTSTAGMTVNLTRQDAEDLVTYLQRVLAKPMTDKEKHAIERDAKWRKENG